MKKKKKQQLWDRFLLAFWTMASDTMNACIMCSGDRASWRLAHRWWVTLCKLLVMFHRYMSSLHSNYVDRQCIMTGHTIHSSVTTYFKATRVVVSPWKLNKWRWSALSAQSGFTGLQALLGRTTNGTKDTFCDTRKSRLTGSWFVQHKHSIKDEHSHLLTTQSWVWCIVASTLGSHCLFGARRYHI